MGKELSWINAVKAICMISVYILHSESYYGINTTSYGQILQPFYVNAFFFVSGYLFFRKHFQIETSYGYSNFWKDIQNIIFRLIIPTIIFASIIYIPKLFFHGREVSIIQYLYDVWGGISFWFTSTITVSQIILLFLLFTNKKNIWFYFIVSIFLFIISIYLYDINKSPFPWFYKSGIGATLFMTLGGIYQQYEKYIDKKFSKGACYALVTIYLTCAVYTLFHNPFRYAVMSMNFNFGGLFITLLGITFIVILCKYLPNFKVLSYIGRHSIVFYFFSGMLPASIGLIFQKIFPDRFYIITILVAIFSICIGLLLTYIINKYIPWLTDIRKLKKQ